MKCVPFERHSTQIQLPLVHCRQEQRSCSDSEMTAHARMLTCRILTGVESSVGGLGMQAAGLAQGHVLAS